jgi:hypothetical protein
MNSSMTDPLLDLCYKYEQKIRLAREEDIRSITTLNLLTRFFVSTRLLNLEPSPELLQSIQDRLIDEYLGGRKSTLPVAPEELSTLTDPVRSTTSDLSPLNTGRNLPESAKGKPLAQQAVEELRKTLSFVGTKPFGFEEVMHNPL